MKKNRLFCLIACLYLFITDSMVASSCLPDNIVFTTQGQVDSFAINYPGCTEILGGVLIGGGDAITNLNGLSQIISIGGSLDISTSLINSNANVLTDLTGLDNLVSIGGNFQIGNYFYDYGPNDEPIIIFTPNILTSLNGLNSLTTIGNNFELVASYDLTDVSALSNLTSIGGNITIFNNDVLTDLSGLDNLTGFNGMLMIWDNELLSDISSLAGFTVTGNETISGLSIKDNPALVSLLGLHDITDITGNPEIQNNDALTTLEGLEGLVNIGGGLRIWYNDALTSLTGLNNLAAMNGLIYIHENGLLTDLEGLNSLNSIGDAIIFRNASLASLNGLENLVSTNGFQVRDNFALTDINALQNLNVIGGQLQIYNNTSLSSCSISSVCTHLFNERPTNINNNLTGCNNEEEILDGCSDFAKIQPHIFYDVNQNQIQDANEPNTDFSVLISPDNYVIFTNSESANNVYLEAGNYTATLNIDNHPNWQLTTDSLSYFLNLEAGACDTITFGVHPTEQVSDIQTFISSPRARCNEFITFDVSTKNLGTTIANGTFWLEVDENILATDFVDTPDTIVASNLYGWFFEDLFPSQCLSRQIDLQIPGPPDFPVGDELFFDAYANFEDENGGQSSQTFTYEAEVRCSFDPNDKLVNPNREGDYTLFDENLIYTIRFQNTGNDVAYDVVIRDTLDANLNLESFNVLGSSHADKLQTSMTTDGMLTFEFRDIFLPDSTSNLEASQGYVTYMISAIDGLAENTPINNSAGIYFDLNPPVLTNITENVMVSELPVVSTSSPDELLNFIISPNPSTGVFEVNDIPQGSYQIHDTTGRVIQSGNMENDLSIDISQEAQGVYFMSIQIDNEVITKRIVKL